MGKIKEPHQRSECGPIEQIKMGRRE